MKIKQNRLSSFVIYAVLLCLVSVGALAEPIVFNNNGVWCWFQDERAIVHNNKLMIGSVSNTGSIEVVQYDIVAGGSPVLAVLHANLQVDDHAAPAFLALPDDRILAVYAKHGNDAYMRYRISTHPNDAASWGAEQIYTAGAGVTYSNVYRLSTENAGSGRIYNFYRGENYNPNFVTSDNNGQTWTYGLPGVTTDGRLIAIGTGGTTRPYVKYTSNNVDKIHFITTEAHPRNYDNSIYYGYLYQGSLYKADGTWLHDTASGGIAPQSLEKIYQGGADHVAWTTDIDLDANGHPYFAFSVQMNQDMNDLRYWYARWDGAQWTVNEIAYAGSALYSAESDYTGLVALDPSDPNVLYISADVHPVTGNPLISAADGKRHYEIFRGTTTDRGVTWRWEYITRNSTQDNIRPIIPQWDGGTILLWMRGRYTTYIDYDMQIVGLFDPEPMIPEVPEITDQPDSTAAPIGGNASFIMEAAGQGTLAYTWFKVGSGSDVQVGSNGRRLNLDNIQLSDVGQYYCVVTNTLGSVTSDVVNLTEANLDAYWPMEGNSNDVTGNGYDASPTGSPVFTSGVFSGQSISLANDSYLTCADSANLTLKDGGTVTAWVKTSALNEAWASIAAKGELGWRLSRNNTSDAVSFRLHSANDEYQANGDITVVDNAWHHLAATYDGQSIKLYVDGQLDAGVSAPEPVNELTDPVCIGSQPVTSGTIVYFDAETGAGGNTARAGDGNVDAWWTSTLASDGLWGKRAFGFDQNGVLNGAAKDIYEGTGNSTTGEDCVMIVTTITGLTPGATYKVDVVFWSSNTQNWNIRAGFAIDSLTLYDRTGSLGTAGTLMPGYHDADRDPYSGLVGYATADTNGEIKVYIDDLSPGTNWNDRSWYDGLLYENISSEPVPAMFWDGQIDEVRIYSYAMDSETIQLLYNQNLSCYQANPYDLNDDCQINLDDVSEFAAFSWLDSGINPQTQVCEAIPQLDITGPADEPDCKVDLYEFADMASVWMQCYLLPTSDCL